MRCLSAGIYFVGMLVKLRGSLPARRLGSSCSAAVCSRASSRGRGCAAARSAQSLPCRARQAHAGRGEAGTRPSSPVWRLGRMSVAAWAAGPICEARWGHRERRWEEVVVITTDKSQGARNLANLPCWRAPGSVFTAALLARPKAAGDQHAAESWPRCVAPAGEALSTRCLRACQCQSQACLTGCNAQARSHAEFPGKHLSVPSRRKTKYHRGGAGFRAACPEGSTGDSHAAQHLQDKEQLWTRAQHKPSRKGKRQKQSTEERLSVTSADRSWH